MSRTITDNPGGWSRSLPGHTVEYEPSFAQSFYYGGALSVAAGASATYTLSISDATHIFFPDIVNVTPQAYKEFSALVFLNDIPYIAVSNIGYVIIPMRTNPSVQLISGDHIDVAVINLDASTRQFLVKINGTKIIRPANFGHAPGAVFISSELVGPAPHTVNCIDTSTYSPTSWEWDFRDGSPKEYTQNVTHIFTVPGVYHILLKATNLYGTDYYSYPFTVT